MRAPLRPVPERASGTATDTITDAFMELHGSRLHGFALLLTLGDRHAAAQLASEALAAGTARRDELRHPERAAAWLRARVLRRHGRRRPEAPLPQRRAALADLGVGEAVFAGLAVLSPAERAAFVAASMERLDPRDVATIAGRDGGRLERMLRGARHRYLDGFTAATDGNVPVDGEIGERVRVMAARTMA